MSGSIKSTLDGAISPGDSTITLDDASNFPAKGFGGIGNYFFSWGSKSGNQLLGCKQIRKQHNHGTEVELDKSATTENIDTFLQLSDYNSESNIGKLLYKNDSNKSDLESVFSVDFGGTFHKYSWSEDNHKYRNFRRIWLEKIFARNSHFVVTAGISAISKNSDDFDAFDIQLNGNYSGLSEIYSKGLVSVIIGSNTKTHLMEWKSRDGNTLRECRFLDKLPKQTQIDPTEIIEIRELRPDAFGTTGIELSRQVIIPFDLSLKDRETVHSAKVPTGAREVSKGVYVVNSTNGSNRIRMYSNTIQIDGEYKFDNHAFGIIGFKQLCGEVERTISFGINFDELLIRNYNPNEAPNSKAKFPAPFNPWYSRNTGDATTIVSFLCRYTPNVKWLEGLLGDYSDDILGCTNLNDCSGNTFQLKKNRYYQFPGNSNHNSSERVSYVIKPANELPGGVGNDSWEYLKSAENHHEISRQNGTDEWPFIDDCLSELYQNGNLVSCGEIITVQGADFEFVGVHEARLEVKRANPKTTFTAVEPPGGTWDLGGTWANYLFDNDKSNTAGSSGFSVNDGHHYTNRQNRMRETSMRVVTSQSWDYFCLFSDGFSATSKGALFARISEHFNINTPNIYLHDFQLGEHFCNDLKMWQGKFTFSSVSERVSHFKKSEFLYANFAELGENKATYSTAKHIVKRYKLQDILNAKTSFIDHWNQSQKDYLRPDPLNSELTSIGEYGDFIVRINDMLKRENFPHNSANDRSYSSETRRGVVMLKQLMYQMNPELCEALQITNSNGHMVCTLQNNACEGSCGCYTWGCWVYHTVTASEGIPIQPLEWLELKDEYDNDSEFNPFEILTGANLTYQESSKLLIDHVNKKIDFVVKPGWKIHLQIDGFVTGNHKIGYFRKKGLKNESRSQFIELRGGDRVCIGFNNGQSPTGKEWENFGDNLAILYQTKKQAEVSETLYEVLYYHGNEVNRKIQLQISCITRPFATQPFELAAGWGHESGVSALARFIGNLADSMSLTVEGMFGLSLSWNGMIELNFEQHFIVEIPLSPTSPVTYFFDYRTGFAVGRDVDLLGSTSFSTSIYGEKHEIPRENWGANLRCLLWETLAGGAAKWLVDPPRRPRSFSSINMSKSTTIVHESNFASVYGHALELRWNGIYSQLNELEAKVKFDRSKLLFNWLRNEDATVSLGSNMNNPIFDKITMGSVNLPSFVNANATKSLNEAKSLANSSKQIKIQKFSIIEIEEDNFVGIEFGFPSNGSKGLIAENQISQAKGYINPFTFDMAQFDIPEQGTIDIGNLTESTTTNAPLIQRGGVAKHSVGLNLNIPWLLPYNFRFIGRIQLKCTGKIDFSLTESVGGED